MGRGAGARDGVSEFTKIPEWFKMMFELFFDPGDLYLLLTESIFRNEVVKTVIKFAYLSVLGLGCWKVHYR